MNQVFVHVKHIEHGGLDGQSDYSAVATDDHVEDVEFTFLEAPDFLRMEPHEIVAVLVGRDGDMEDLIQAAVTNGTPVHVNGVEMSLDAYAGSSAPRP